MGLAGSGYERVASSCGYGNVPSGSMKGGGGLLASQGLLHRASPLDMNTKNDVPKCEQ
jgi:hypothetical protein